MVTNKASIQLMPSTMLMLIRHLLVKDHELTVIPKPHEQINI